VALNHHNFRVVNNDLNACFNLTNSVSYDFLGVSRIDRGEKILMKGYPYSIRTEARYCSHAG